MKDQKLMMDRMDVRTILTGSGKINVLGSVLLEPYQIKLISNLGSGEFEEDQLTK